MRRTCVLVLASAAALCVGCGGPVEEPIVASTGEAPPASGSTVHATSSFSLATPADWVDAGSRANFVKYESARGSDATVAAAFLASTHSLDEDAAAWRALLESMHDGASCAVRVEPATLLADAALRLHANCTPAATNADFVVFVVAHENRIFDVTCGGTGDTSACAQIVDSFRFLR